MPAPGQAYAGHGHGGSAQQGRGLAAYASYPSVLWPGPLPRLQRGGCPSAGKAPAQRWPAEWAAPHPGCASTLPSSLAWCEVRVGASAGRPLLPAQSSAQGAQRAPGPGQRQDGPDWVAGRSLAQSTCHRLKDALKLGHAPSVSAAPGDLGGRLHVLRPRTQCSPGLVPPQSLPLISASRWLLKRGELSVAEETGLFRKLASRPTCYLFLFNDVLVVTRKKRWALPVGHGQKAWPGGWGSGLGPGGATYAS